MHQSGKLAVSQEDRKPLALVGFLPLLLAACQPVITRYGQQNLRLSENQATGGEIGLSFEATDADTPQDQLVWDVTDNRFELRAKSDGRYHLVLKDGQILDYEDSRNTGGNLDLAVLLWDGLHTAVHYLRLQFSDVNDHAPVFTSQAQKQVAPNLGAGAEIYQAVTTDADGTAANRAVSYSLSGADAGKLSINATNGKVILNSPPTASSYSFTVTATNGALSTAQEVTINFTGNLSPVLVGSGPPDLHLTGGLAFADQTLSGYFSDPEGQSLSFSASRLPSGLTLSSPGVLSGSLTNAMSGSYSVTLTASDPQGASASDQFTLTIGQSYTDTDGDDVLTGTGYRDFFNLGFNGGTDKIDGGAGSDILSLASWTGNSNGGGGGGEETEESAAGAAGLTINLSAAADTDGYVTCITGQDGNDGGGGGEATPGSGNWQASPPARVQADFIFTPQQGNSPFHAFEMLEVHSDYCCCSDCASLGQLQNQVFEVDPVIPPLADADTLKVKNVEILIATSRDDTITGSSAQDWIDGGAGNDVINGGARADTLIGGAGNDQMTGGAAADLFVFAGTDYGRDMITDYSQSAGDILRLEDIAAADLRISTAGETQTGGHLLIYKSGQSSLTDTEGNYLILGNIAAGRFQLDLRASDSSFFAGQDFTFGTSGNDSITGTAGRDIVWAFGGDDQITGRATADTLFGMGGNDTLSGGAGDDRLEGGSGADTLNSGAGSDQLNGGDGADIADLSGGGGAVLADLSLTTRWKIGANGWESGSLSDYTHYRVTDSFGAFDYLGLVEGLKGGSEADTLTGNAQNNTLSGGTGNDTLNGGGGSDIFVNYKFSSRTVAGSEDVITDFLDGTDLIGLEKAHSGSTAVTFSDLTLTSVTRQDGGTDTRITAGSKYLWLVENTAPADFSVADFIAVGLASDGFA